MSHNHYVIYLAVTLALLFGSCSPKQESIESITDRVFHYAADRYKSMDKDIPAGKALDSATAEGELRIGSIYGWTSGFYPGTLWYIYEYTGDESIRDMAVRRTEDLEPVKDYTDNHDVGFMMNCSYGNGFRLTGNEKYKDILITTARSLITRYNDTVGCIQSWNSNDRWAFPVIIDNMMNLELLMKATELSGDETFAKIANTHSKTTARSHFRPNYSSYHVIDYNPSTGEVLHRNTSQGFADSSSWARGQSWGLYGYTMMYKETGDEQYLQLAENIADYIIGRSPEDMVPYWDYDCPDIPNTYYEVTAAAITASALVDLSQLTKNTKSSEKYLRAAETAIRTLASDRFLTREDEYAGFILKHSNGSIPHGAGVDIPLTYADYYYLEALLRYKALKK